MAVSRLSQQSIQQAFPKGVTVWDGTTNTSSFDSLGAVTLSADTSVITFSNIPQTYTHLQLRGVSKSTYASSNGQSGVKIQFNGDTAGNYMYHWLSGNGSAASSTASSTGQVNLYFESPWAGNGAFGTLVMDLVDYTSVNKNKTARILSGADWNAASNNQNVRLYSGLWLNSSSGISTITITQTTPYSDGVFAANSTFALYGVK